MKNVRSLVLVSGWLAVMSGCAPEAGSAGLSTADAVQASPETVGPPLECSNDAPFARVTDRPVAAPIARDPAFFIADDGFTEKPVDADAEPSLLVPEVRTPRVAALLDPSKTGIDPVAEPDRYARHKARVVRAER
jgi:hypothetical protein